MAPSAEEPGTPTVNVRKAVPAEAPAPDAAAAVLAAPALEELAAAWLRGECLSAEEVLHRHPAVREHPEAAVRLIYEEVCLREEHGQAVSAAEVVGRFPLWRAELEVLLDCHGLLNALPAAPDFPGVGETLGGLKLLAELGRGTHGRVFLAIQPALADRPVVLKLTSLDTQEHFSLARLQHTHIVPLYWAEDFPARNLRMLCMPYLGGATFSQLLAVLRTVPPAERSGQHLLRALDAVQAQIPARQEPPQNAVDGPARQFLAGVSCEKALCWVGACLADALDYAHQRGLVHLDLKPSNVLLAADGTPMLLDFHLARAPLRPGQASPESFGGTPLYMSPEQQAASIALSAAQPVTAAVDQRSDLYSLAVLLCEALSGSAPAAGSRTRLDRCNPEVSPGLADVLDRCLAVNPADRYPNAATLATDLRRHLGDLPLRGVRNRSLPERWRKWRRRRPQTLPVAALLAVLLAALLAGWVGLHGQAHGRLEQATTALAEGKRQLAGGDFVRAMSTLERGRDLAADTRGGESLARELDQQLRRARRTQIAWQLHTVVHRLGFLLTADGIPPRQVRELEVHCRTLWEQRARILEAGGAGLDGAAEEQLRTDLLDLATFWVGLRVSLAGGQEATTARRAALKVLDEAEGLFGVSPVLEQERRAYAEQLGLADVVQEAESRLATLKPRTPWERYALGRELLREGKLEQAATELARVCDADPGSFWPNFSAGVCAYRRKRYGEAVHAFGICIALAPRTAECYYNRSLAHAAAGQPEQALHDCDRALELDPNLAAAAQNRGLLHYRAGRHVQAKADLERALARGLETGPVYYQLALIQEAQGQKVAARVSVQRALRLSPGLKEALILRQRLRQAEERRPH